MLFGDWGTSRLYVLGICFYHTRHASRSKLVGVIDQQYSILHDDPDQHQQPNERG